MGILELALDLPDQRRRAIFARLAAQFGGPAGVLDHRPGDCFVVKRSGFVDMRRKHDPERPLEGAAGVARPNAGAGTRELVRRGVLAELRGRARVDHVAGRALTLGRTAGEVAAQVGAEGRAEPARSCQ